MASDSISVSEEQEIEKLLLVDINKPIEMCVENSPTKLPSWGNFLSYLPPFPIKEIEERRLKSGKTPESAIIKTLDRGRKFKNERYLSADSVYTQ